MSEMIEIRVPEEQEGTKAIVRNWLVKVGEQVALDAPLVELETDKVTQEVPSPATGVLSEIMLDTDAEAEPGALLGRMQVGDAPAEPSADGTESEPQAKPDSDAAKSIQTAEHRLSPSVRRAVKEHDVDPALIDGTGRGGRITRADVDAFVAARKAETAPREAAADISVAARSTATPAPAPSAGGVTVIPHDRMRKAIAENMLNSVTVAPHVTAIFECDFTAIMAHRRRHKASFEAEGAKLTFTAYFLAAAAQAMKVAPAINSRWYDDRLDLYADVNIGVGTALGDKGLVVPVVKQCQRQSLLGIAHSLTDLTSRARSSQLTPADMKDGTFTLSNHGVSGSLLASPIIINQPQSAILGIGKTEKRVVVRDVGGVDAIQIRPMAYVSLTIDHRVVDGHQTNAWLTKFVEVLESWPLD